MTPILSILNLFINKGIMLTSSLPFKIPQNDNSTIKPVTSEGLFGGLVGNFSSIMAPVYSWGVKFITILFVLGTLVMIFSALFKNGQWQKYAQLTMLLSFVSMLLLRGLPIIILSVQSSADIDYLLQDALSMLSFGAIYVCLISIAVSFLFSFGYRLIEHPEFHRWSKTLRSVSVMMMLFAVVIPLLFPII